MLAGIHFFSSSAIASNFASDYLTAFIIGFSLHHLEDFLPHLDLNIFKHHQNLGSIKNWGLKIWLLVLLEFLFFFSLTIYLIRNLPSDKLIFALIGGLSGLMPDIISFSVRSFFPQALNFKIINYYQYFHQTFHFSLKNESYLLPILVEIIIILISFYLLTVNINY